MLNKAISLNKDNIKLTLTVVEGCCSSAHSPCTLHYPLLYSPMPTQPAEKKKKSLFLGNKTDIQDGYNTFRLKLCVTCSWTSSKSELSSSMKIGTAPASITVFVCMDVPDAMLVNAQAASNCRCAKCHRKR